MATVAVALRSKLLPAGFLSKAPHLWREGNDIIHVINLQASQWGTAFDGSFTMNLAVTNRRLYSIWTGHEFPKNPGSATWPVQCRIGRLLSDTDLWWSVSPTINVEATVSEIVETTSGPILEFFSAYSSLGELDAKLATAQKYGDVPGVYESQVPLIRAIICSIRGDTEQAGVLLSRSLAAVRGKPFQSTVEVVAGRLGVNVA